MSSGFLDELEFQIELEGDQPTIQLDFSSNKHEKIRKPTAGRIAIQLILW